MGNKVMQCEMCGKLTAIDLWERPQDNGGVEGGIACRECGIEYPAYRITSAGVAIREKLEELPNGPLRNELLDRLKLEVTQHPNRV